MSAAWLMSHWKPLCRVTWMNPASLWYNQHQHTDKKHYCQCWLVMYAMHLSTKSPIFPLSGTTRVIDIKNFALIYKLLTPPFLFKYHLATQFDSRRIFPILQRGYWHWRLPTYKEFDKLISQIPYMPPYLPGRGGGDCHYSLQSVLYTYVHVVQ